MNKINLGLLGLLVIILLMLFDINNSKKEYNILSEDLIIIKSILEDVDSDIHSLEERLK